jgi:hypothetical protein
MVWVPDVDGGGCNHGSSGPYLDGESEGGSEFSGRDRMIQPPRTKMSGRVIPGPPSPPLIALSHVPANSLSRVMYAAVQKITGGAGG